MELKGAGDAASAQTVQATAVCTKFVPSSEQHHITDGGGLSLTADWRCPRAQEDLLKPLRKRLEARVVELGFLPRLVKHISSPNAEGLLRPEEVEVIQTTLLVFQSKLFRPCPRLRDAIDHVDACH